MNLASDELPLGLNCGPHCGTTNHEGPHTFTGHCACPICHDKDNTRNRDEYKPCVVCFGTGRVRRD